MANTYAYTSSYQSEYHYKYVQVEYDYFFLFFWWTTDHMRHDPSVSPGVVPTESATEHVARGALNTHLYYTYYQIEYH